MGRTFIQRLLITLSKRKKKDSAISEEKNKATIRDKAGNKTAKTANTRSKANIKEEHKAKTEVETEEKNRSCAVEIGTCIDLINNSSIGTPGKPKRGRRRAKADDRKTDKSSGNRKTSSSSNNDTGMKRSKQDVSPAEMVVLLAKVEEKVSEAVFKAKEKDNKKKKKRRKK